ncbi:hypothetical protein YQE_04673, partial [Dendroctonus ponderosae]
MTSECLLATASSPFLGRFFSILLMVSFLTEAFLALVLLMMAATSAGEVGGRRLPAFSLRSILTVLLTLYDKVKKLKGAEIINKVDAVEGDVMLPNLGISEKDRIMLANEVQLILHCAATIRFDETLKKAVLLNARGTKFMLELAKECKQLQCFVHVSTAYCHLSERILYERPYAPPADPHKVIQTAEWLSDDVMETITPKPIYFQEEEVRHLRQVAPPKTMCDENKLVEFLAERQITNPESIVGIAIADFEGTCSATTTTVRRIEEYLKNCTATEGLYLNLINGLRTFDSKLCKNNDFYKKYDKFDKCYTDLNKDYEVCNGMPDWNESSPEKACKSYKKIVDCFYIRTAKVCGLRAASTLKELMVEVIDCTLPIKCAVGSNPKVKDAIILQDIPNTYAFTKALGEALVVEQHGKLPVMILRPSVVIPIWKEPIPGWTDNINGPTGLLIGAGKGVLRTMYCKQDAYADYMPVDIVVNATLASVWFYIYDERKKWIFNLTSSALYKITMEEIINIGRKVINTKIPLNGVAWYPGGSMKRSKIVHYICFFLFHIIPAVLVDALLLVIGYKPVLCRVQNRIWKGFEVFEYYANNQWDFDNQESLSLRDALLNPRERENYKCDGDGIDYFEYFSTCVHAARLYILKETDDTLPAARRHMFVMWIVDKVCKGLFLFAVMYYLYQKVLSPLLAAV